jgi:hypothetical protein
MRITDYYTLIRKEGKTRFDELFSTESYPPFENLRNKEGNLSIYLLPYEKLNSKLKGFRQPKFCITKGQNLSGIYGLEQDAKIGFGDMAGTQDALLFRLHGTAINTLEIFVLRGLKLHKQSLFTLFKEGELHSEMENIWMKGKREYTRNSPF